MKITDELLYQHVAEARDIWLDTLPKDEDLLEHQFSNEFMASFEHYFQWSSDILSPWLGRGRYASKV